MSRKHPPYPPKFRARRVELVRSGRSSASLAREFEPSANSIRNWVKQADLEGRRDDGLTTEEREELGAEHCFIRSGRPQTNGCVERFQGTVLEGCWKPAFARYLVPKQTGLRRDLEQYMNYYNFDRAHTGRWTNGRTPAQVIGAKKCMQVDDPGVASTPGQDNLGRAPGPCRFRDEGWTVGLNRVARLSCERPA